MPGDQCDVRLSDSSLWESQTFGFNIDNGHFSWVKVLRIIWYVLTWVRDKLAKFDFFK
jgi:hypothetical protein